MRGPRFPGRLGGAVLPVAMTVLLALGMLAAAAARSALVQRRVATSLHELLRADLAAESALREAEGVVWRVTTAGTAAGGCLPFAGICTVARAGMAFTILDLGGVSGAMDIHRYRLTARGEGTSEHVARTLESVIVTGPPSMRWRRESWRIVGDD